LVVDEGVDPSRRPNLGLSAVYKTAPHSRCCPPHLVRATGFEPALPFEKEGLSLPRLPVPATLAMSSNADILESQRSFTGGEERSRTPNPPSLTDSCFQDSRTCPCTNLSKLGGDGEIRTHVTPFEVNSLSKRAVSATHPRLRMTAGNSRDS
jgi:hypothetical protein